MFFTLQTSSATIYPRSPCVSLRLATSRALLVYRQSYRVTLIKSHPVTPLIIETVKRAFIHAHPMNLFFLTGLSETIALHTDQTFLDSITIHGRLRQYAIQATKAVSHSAIANLIGSVYSIWHPAEKTNPSRQGIEISPRQPALQSFLDSLFESCNEQIGRGNR